MVKVLRYLGVFRVHDIFGSEDEISGSLQSTGYIFSSKVKLLKSLFLAHWISIV